MAWFLSGFVRQSLSFGGLARDGSNTSPGNSPFVAEQPWRSVTVHGSMAWPGGKIRGISEDALSWNVFVSLARLGILGAAIPELGSGTENVELYLWGNRIADGKPRFWDKLDRVRKTLEPGAAFPTEPDIMLRVPGHALVLIEAKFGSPNSTLAGKEDRFESVEDFLARYPAPEGAADPLARDWIEQQQLGTVLEQLCRNVVYATWLAEPRRATHGHQPRPRGGRARRRDPSSSPPRQEWSGIFRCLSWESFHPVFAARGSEARPVVDYLENKTMNLSRAFRL
jgi:hypothetical protein